VRSGIDALTPSERRVSALAADGLANAEIAQALFVTVRTVEMHLSAAYRKLEISSRAALPQTLRSGTVAKQEGRPHPAGMTSTDKRAPIPIDADLTASASRMRWAGLSGRASGSADASRQPLVFLHGLTFDRHMWDPVLDALPDEQQAIAFDLPGHGGSPALDRHDLARVVDAVHEAVIAAGLERPIIVGHSISAAIAAIYAASYPAAGIVNVDGGVRPDPHLRFLQSIEPQLRAQFDTVWSTIFRPSMHIEQVPDEQRGLLRAGEHVEQALVLGYWADLLGSSADDLAARVETMMRRIRAARLPYLSISREPLPPEDEAWLRERLPWAELEVWPVGHHFPHLEKPEGFAGLVVAFAEGARV
jgi:pimeloyl-ACP methyl ester carboxylesterase/DNA-binding CsgD family transcriptional regulator